MEEQEHKTERALVTIRVIEELKPIEGADLIEAARVDGWWCVTKKGEFAVGDLAVYYEPDSFLPIRPEYEFLRKSSFRKNWDGTEGFRLKTIKLRGQLSQGLLLPVYGVGMSIKSIDLHSIRGDLTEALGVTKWERPISPQLAGVAKGNFPTFVPKTDEHRIQNLGRELPKMLEASDWVVREKLDGTSMTVYLKDGYFGVCSRNMDLLETEDSMYWEFARRVGMENTMRKLAEYPLMPRNWAVQGELVGPGIQGNSYKLQISNLYLFSIWNIDKQEYMTDHDLSFVADMMGLRKAPLFCECPGQLPDRQTILEKADGPSMLHPDAMREGLVWRHYADGKLVHSFKAISNSFLVKEKD